MEHQGAEIEEIDFPEFNAQKMERFIEKDLFAAKLFKGLKSGSKEERLEIIFNTCVLEDSIASSSYEAINEEKRNAE